MTISMSREDVVKVVAAAITVECVRTKTQIRMATISEIAESAVAAIEHVEARE
jgi:hypothetical protein